MTRATQIHPKTKKVIRQVEVIERMTNGDVRVRALNGPLAGSSYTVTSDCLIGACLARLPERDSK